MGGAGHGVEIIPTDIVDDDLVQGLREVQGGELLVQLCEEVPLEV